MELIPIVVICHSGYKLNEYPKSFTWYDKEFQILEIIDRWYQGEHDPTVPPADYFKVKVNDGSKYLLKHDQTEDNWLLVI